jgi:hypothetical protein
MGHDSSAPTIGYHSRQVARFPPLFRCWLRNADISKAVRSNLFAK